MCSSIMHHYPTCQWHIVSFSQNHNVFIKSSDDPTLISRFHWFSANESESRIQLPNVDSLIPFLCREMTIASSIVKSTATIAIYFMHRTRSSGSPKITIYFLRRSGDLNQFLPAAVCRKFRFYSTSSALHRYWVP